jgi:hypothetical protein
MEAVQGDQALEDAADDHSGRLLEADSEPANGVVILDETGLADGPGAVRQLRARAQLEHDRVVEALAEGTGPFGPPFAGHDPGRRETSRRQRHVDLDVEIERRLGNAAQLRPPACAVADDMGAGHHVTRSDDEARADRNVAVPDPDVAAQPAIVDDAHGAA